MEKKRSVGVTIFAILEFWYLIGFLLLPQSTSKILDIPIINIVSCILRAIFAICAPICGIGLWFLKEWGRKLVMIKYTILVFYSILYLVIGVFYVDSHSDISFINILTHGWHIMLFGLLIIAIPIYFFTRPRVKEQFK